MAWYAVRSQHREMMMSRISIDVSDEEHQKLKAMAALKGMSIKEFVLTSTLGTHGEDPALTELEALLDKRIERAKVEGASLRSVEDVFDQARAKAKRGHRA